MTLAIIVCEHCGKSGKTEHPNCECGRTLWRCGYCGYTDRCWNENCTRLHPFKPNQIYQGNCIELMKDLPDESVDLIIADPPFGIKFNGKPSNYNRKDGLVIDGYGEISPDDYPEFSQAWISEAARLLKLSGSMYIVSGWNNLELVLRISREVGLTLKNHIIWKYQFGVACQKKYVTSHYHILYFVKKDKKQHWKKRERYPEDVWLIKRKYHRGETKTPTRLPEGLVQKMISFSSYTGDLVLDPFIGSGTTASTAYRMFRQYIGFEIVPEYYQFAQERLKEIMGDSPPGVADEWIMEEWSDELRERYEQTGS